MAFSGSANSAHQYSVVPPDKAKAAVRSALATFPQPLSDDCLSYLVRDFRFGHLARLTRSQGMCSLLRATQQLAAVALADFLEFQSIAALHGMPFHEDPSVPKEIARLYTWGAERLHKYGREQSKQLGRVVAGLRRWALTHELSRADIIESPLGSTVPACVMAQSLRNGGIDVQVHELLAPRLDRHGKKYSLNAAVRELVQKLDVGNFPVLFPDEILTGTRFKKLIEALHKCLGPRLIPIGLEVLNLGSPTPDQKRLGVLRNYLAQLPASKEGAPTHTIFPPAVAIRVDPGQPVVCSSPFFWSEMDICAGKRKVNLLFGFIDILRQIARALCTPDSEAHSRLATLWGESTDGIRYVGHEQFSSRIVSEFASRIDWQKIESDAKATYPDEYRGGHPAVTEEWVSSRRKWVLNSVYEQLLPLSTMSEGGASEAGVVVNALDALFASTGGLNRPPLPRDRDFCETTIPYVFPVRAFHDELVRLIVDDIPDLEIA